MGTFRKLFRRARTRLFKLFFFGSTCSCMFCGESYRRFMHQGIRADLFKKYQVTGAGYRKNVRCPNCGSRHRQRLLHLFLEFRTDIYRRKVKLLHISPSLRLARVIRSHGTIDYVCGALHPDRFSELDAVELDVTRIQFAEGEFDVVLCNHVLEHVPDDETAMREIYRVLAPGGFAVLQVPLALDLQVTLEDPSINDGEQRKKAFGQKDHVRLYGLDYFTRLEGAGFTVVRDNPLQNRWPVDVKKYCLDEKEDVIIGLKGPVAAPGLVAGVPQPW